MTSEEITAKRRAERKQFKLDRARAIAAAAAEAEAAFAEGRVVTPPSEGAIPSAATWRPPPKVVEESPGVVGEQDEPLEDLEHLQLTLQEAWFLVWGFDCLTVLDPGSVSP
jgi:tRNA-splicing endonuclease subunit Sen2